MIITLGGKAGSGKGTVRDMLAHKLGYEVISIGDTKRELAKQMGLTIFEFNELGDLPENKAEFDLKYEEYQQGLSLDSKVILDSRLGFYNQPNAFKVFIDVGDEEAARRIFGANRSTDQYSCEAEVLRMTQARNTKDRQRYIGLYSVDIYDMQNYDLFVDSTDLTPDDVLDRILQKFATFEKNC